MEIRKIEERSFIDRSISLVDPIQLGVFIYMWFFRRIRNWIYLLLSKSISKPFPLLTTETYRAPEPKQDVDPGLFLWTQPIQEHCSCMDQVPIDHCIWIDRYGCHHAFDCKRSDASDIELRIPLYVKSECKK